MKYLILLVSLFISISHAASQTEDEYTISNNYQKASIWQKFAGKPAPEPRLYLGMWSAHSTSKERNGRNDMVGFSYQSYTAGTLLNSFGNRAYTVGIQRYWLTDQLYGDVNYEVGFRLGLITGYKGHDVSGIRFLKNSPIVPYVQLVAALNWKYFGWEISSPNPSVISTGFYFRFL